MKPHDRQKIEFELFDLLLKLGSPRKRATRTIESVMEALQENQTDKEQNTGIGLIYEETQIVGANCRIFVYESFAKAINSMGKGNFAHSKPFVIWVDSQNSSKFIIVRW